MRDRRGFTLIEIIMALTILGIMVTIASSNLMLWLDHAAAVDFQKGLLARNTEARTRAMALNLQHRVFLQLDNSTVTLQVGNRASGSDDNAWVDVGTPIEGKRSAGIHEIAVDNATPWASGTASLIYNPGGQVQARDNTAIPTSVTQARIRLDAANPTDRATVRVFGFTSKARLENGWN